MNLSPEEFETAIAEMGFVSPEGNTTQYYWSPCWDLNLVTRSDITKVHYSAGSEWEGKLFVLLDMGSTIKDRLAFKYKVQCQLLSIYVGTKSQGREEIRLEDTENEGYSLLLEAVARYKAKAQAMYDEIPKT
jgi:hypothetical protein